MQLRWQSCCYHGNGGCHPTTSHPHPSPQPPPRVCFPITKPVRRVNKQTCFGECYILCCMLAISLFASCIKYGAGLCVCYPAVNRETSYCCCACGGLTPRTAKGTMCGNEYYWYRSIAWGSLCRCCNAELGRFVLGVNHFLRKSRSNKLVAVSYFCSCRDALHISQ